MFNVVNYTLFVEQTLDTVAHTTKRNRNNTFAQAVI